jgi:hypothetical protein
MLMRSFNLSVSIVITKAQGVRRFVVISEEGE